AFAPRPKSRPQTPHNAALYRVPPKTSTRPHSLSPSPTTHIPPLHLASLPHALGDQEASLRRGPSENKEKKAPPPRHTHKRRGLRVLADPVRSQGSADRARPPASPGVFPENRFGARASAVRWAGCTSHRRGANLAHVVSFRLSHRYYKRPCKSPAIYFSRLAAVFRELAVPQGQGPVAAVRGRPAGRDHRVYAAAWAGALALPAPAGCRGSALLPPHLT
ncbi:MAG: hypothetical protein BJ554DRAFT_4805, partial [Olpidium bornovanus]